ncbi:PilW family protein [Sporomusa malonica]|uniref:Prepilin-type N-terminal cleavage/methylation domain-containing protein n=1 Tax=Sporomusa malonica TaxID=112901 RepID=A0A1W2EBG7_9FIRM|nr:hypothetical protein [Sporomusa malonica]SMD06428.1 hypothetical protein SAMN04488500_12273 [Sporomusa malonica]
MLKLGPSQDGFSLIEIMVWLMLTTILMTALAGVFFSLTNFWFYGDRRYDVQQTANLVMETMANDLRYGSNYNYATHNSANTNEAISFAPEADTAARYIYYIDKTSRQLYRVPGYTAADAELVPGQTGVWAKNINIVKQTDITPIFSINNSSITIAFRVTESSKNQNYNIQTTVTPIREFLVR